jgi:hypothetical protein
MTKLPIAIDVDFNRLDERNVLWSPRSLAPYVDRGEYVELFDGDGNRCLGKIVRTTAKRNYIRAFLSTWQDAAPVATTHTDETLDEALRKRVHVTTDSAAPTSNNNPLDGQNVSTRVASIA